MINGALYLDEDLASHIALKFVDHLRRLVDDLRLQMIHVVRPDVKPQSVGYGWVRRTWENGVLENGLSTITRLLRTENVQFPCSGPPKVFLGNRDKETLAELTDNIYDLFIEGDQSTSSSKDFLKRINSRLYKKAPCPILMVRNQVKKNQSVLLAEEGTNIKQLADQFGRLMHSDKLSVDLIFYKAPQYNKWDSHMAAATFAEAGEFETAKEFLQKNNSLKHNEKFDETSLDPETLASLEKIKLNDMRFVSGATENLTVLLKDYDLVASSFPARQCPHIDALAATDASVMLFK